MKDFMPCGPKPSNPPCHGLLALCLMLVSTLGFAQERSASSRKSSENHHIGLEFGLRYQTHYDVKQQRSIKIAPPALLAEIQLNVLLTQALSVHALYGHGFLINSSAAEVGGGLKLRFLSVGQSKSKSASVSALHLELVGDIIQYSMNAPKPPDIYENKGFGLRFGGAMQIDFGGKSYLDLVGQAMRFGGVFFFAPYAGYGFYF